MAEHPLNSLGLCEAELLALAKAAQSRLIGRPIPQAANHRRKIPASSGGNFLGFREYREGDSLRTVNWRASARSGSIQTQIYESELASQWYICLDGSASMGVGANRRKWLFARQIAAAFAYLLLYGGNPAGLLAFSGKVDAYCPPGRSRSQYPRLLNLLKDCFPKDSGGDSLLTACGGFLSAGASILVLSDFLDQGAMQRTVGQWRHCGFTVHALQILADDECRLPLGESLRIKDIESGDMDLMDADADAMRSAMALLSELTARLDENCSRLGIVFTAASTGQGWKQAVLEHLFKAGLGR